MKNSPRIWLPAVLKTQLETLADEHYPKETGGMLLGYFAENGDAVITALIGPGPNATHGKRHFRPDARYQQGQLTKHHERTDGVESYLGDWHTHPDGFCSLSYRDRRTLRRIAETPDSRIDRPLMALLAGHPASWRFAAFQYPQSKRPYLSFFLDPRPQALMVSYWGE